ncbi:MAG: DUF2911 domain-containing protein, partial [Luteibaculum sp.]
MQERVSPPDTVSGSIDGVELSIAYSQPSVRERVIWGDLVPYSKIWRAGANEATVISFDQDVAINGKGLAKGSYSFFLVPEKGAAWTAIFNSDADQWGAYKHDPKKDKLRVSCKPEKHEFTEQMTFVIEGEQFYLIWEKLKI